MRDERECVICGTHYSYCPNCVDYSRQPRWKFLFHDQNCHDIYNVLNDYNANVITKDEAQAKLNALDLSKLNTFRKDFRDQINEIMKVEVKPVVQTEVPKQDATKQNGYKQFNNKKYHK